MIQYPVHFTAVSSANSGIDSNWSVVCGSQQTSCAVPPEFSGSGGGFSPEDLYLQALTNCFVATFKVYAAASRLEFESVRVDSKMIVDKDEEGQPWMKEADFQVKIQGASSPDRLKTLADKAIRSGFILNSVKTKMNWSVEMTGYCPGSR